MSSLPLEMRLQRAPELRLHVKRDRTIEITGHAGQVLRGGRHTLAVLDAFFGPTKIGAAIERLTSWVSNEYDSAELCETISDLLSVGALVDPGHIVARITPRARTFSGMPVHILMLNDRVRTTRMIAAINAVVQAGDVVVEVGTGTGVLAVAAARAGARHVYAIECGAMASVAREMVQANGLADRVTVIGSLSSDVTLPEKADVFVSETIGNAAFDENILTISRDALVRHLKPNARMIPSELILFGLPVQAPAEWIAQHRVLEEPVATWREWYGIDFSSLMAPRPGLRDEGKLMKLPKPEWPTLGKPVRLAGAKFGPDTGVEMATTNTITATREGELNALIVFFEAILAPRMTLSTDPRQPHIDFPANWYNPVWLVSPLQLCVRDKVRVEFAWEECGSHFWNVFQV